MKRETTASIRKWLSIAVVLIYAVGLVLMLVGYFGQGLSLWFVSTAGGALLLYVKRTQEKKAADERAIEEEEAAYQKKLRETQGNGERK